MANELMTTRSRLFLVAPIILRTCFQALSFEVIMVAMSLGNATKRSRYIGHNEDTSVVCSSSFASRVLSFGFTLSRDQRVDVCLTAAGQLSHLPAVIFSTRYISVKCDAEENI